MNRRIALAAIAVLILGACAAPPAPKSEIPFAVRSWPASGDAPCAVDASGVLRAGLRRIVAESELSVRFDLCAPDPAFVQKLAVPNFAVQDSGWLAAAIADGSLTTSANGTGPFALAAWSKGSQIVLARNDAYWGAHAAAAKFVVQWQAESAARLLALRAGTVDAIDNLAPTDAAAVRGDTSLALLPRAGFNTFYVNINNRFAPFDDARVRKAVALALDRGRIVAQFYPEGSTVATHVPPCVIDLACGGAEWYAQDRVAAKALLAEAGYANGFATTLSYRVTPRAYLPNPKEVAIDLQSQLAAIGVTVTLDEREPGSYIDDLLSGRMQGLSFSAALPDYPEAWNALGIDFGAESGPTHGDRYPTIVALLDGAARARGDSARGAAFAALNDEIRALVPVIPIANGSSLIATRADVRDLVASPVATEQFVAARAGSRDAFVFMQGAEPAGIYCMDEEDREATRLCAQVTEGLFGYAAGSTAAEPRLATGCTTADDGLSVTCAIRPNVRFHNGARLDAADVLDSFAAAWDCAHPLHVGRTGDFRAWSWIMGTLHPERCAAP